MSFLPDEQKYHYPTNAQYSKRSIHTHIFATNQHTATNYYESPQTNPNQDDLLEKSLHNVQFPTRYLKLKRRLMNQHLMRRIIQLMYKSLIKRNWTPRNSQSLQSSHITHRYELCIHTLFLAYQES